jgi:hypothetical protein
MLFERTERVPWGALQMILYGDTKHLGSGL